MSIKLLIICCYIFGSVLTDKPIISFNVFERDDPLGQYSAQLSIPSLQIKAESNLTLNKRNDFSDDYSIDIKLEEPFGLDFNGVINTSIDSQLMAKVFDVYLQSKTFSHLNTRSRTSISKNVDKQTIILTNVTLDDSLYNISVKYNSTLILSQSCPTITLFHNLTTIPDNSLLYFSSNVTEVCDLANNSSEMSINISMSSIVWQLVNLELKQIFNFGKNYGSESMNASHPLMDISVVANWDRTAKLIHFKKAMFESKVKQLIPSFELEFKKYRELPNQFLITIFKEVPNILDNIREQNVRQEL